MGRATSASLNCLPPRATNSGRRSRIYFINHLSKFSRVFLLFVRLSDYFRRNADRLWSKRHALILLPERAFSVSLRSRFATVFLASKRTRCLAAEFLCCTRPENRCVTLRCQTIVNSIVIFESATLRFLPPENAFNESKLFVGRTECTIILTNELTTTRVDVMKCRSLRYSPTLP